jgi:mono/diheme cytochrome c family protein
LKPAANPEQGNTLWIDNCAGCHGESGRGDGPAAQWLIPMPTNLAQRDYSDKRIADILWNGVHGTSMSAWRDQSSENLSSLAAVVRNFGPQQDVDGVLPSLIEAGEYVYVTHCAECHGDNGDGNGFAAKELPIMPSDFRGERPTLEESIRILQNGIEGTSMAPWTDRLSEDEIVAVSHFVRQFFKTDKVTGAD